MIKLMAMVVAVLPAAVGLAGGARLDLSGVTARQTAIAEGERVDWRVAPEEAKAIAEWMIETAQRPVDSNEVAVANPPRDMKLFLLIGQSNMAGRGTVSEEDRKAPPRCLKLNRDGVWVAATAPIHFDRRTAGYGIADTFVRRYLEEHPNDTVGLIPCAVGGSMSATWSPEDTAPDPIGSNYRFALNRARLAQRNGQIAGILWHQGEADRGFVREQKGRGRYVARLAALAAALRRELGCSNAPFLIGEIGTLPVDCTVMNSVLAAAADIIPNCKLVKASDLTGHLPDGVHFDTPSYKILGARYYEAWKTVALTDVAAYVWPAYQNEPRWAELGVFGAGKGGWQNVWEAVPKWKGHRQPLVPTWGYEDESDPKIVERKIDAAVSHGVNVFIYDWYWYGGRPFLENGLNRGFLGAKNNAKMKFFVMWANHHVNWLWDNKVADKRWSSPRKDWLGYVTDGEFRTKLVPRWIAQYFTRPNYYRIGGKPVLMIYDVGTFIQGVGGVEKASAAIAYLRAEAAKAGLGGVHLMACDYGLKAEWVKALGIDSATIYNFIHWASANGNPDYADWAKKGAARFDAARRELGLAAYFPHVSVGWDTNPRYPAGSVQPTVLGSTPAKFEAALRRAKAWGEANVPEGMPKLVTVNSWNEWTEGSYLEPDTANGFGYLDAIRHVVAPAAKPYVVTWCGRAAEMFPARVSAYPFCRVWPGHQRDKSQTETVWCVRFDAPTDGVVSVRAPGIARRAVRLLPLKDAACLSAAGNDELRLAVSRPGAYVLTVDGLPTLHVFADPPLAPIPTPGPGGRLIRFARGEHHPGVVAPKSGDVVVLDEGAVVYGSLFVLNATNVTVTGRGIFDGSRLERSDETMRAFRRARGLPEIDTESACFAYSVYGSENVTVSGVTFRDAPFWTFAIRNHCRRTLIDNIHIVGNWRYNSDGIDVCASADTVIRNSFFRTFDDCVIARGPYLKGESEPVDGLVVTNCDLFCDWGCAVKAQVQDFSGSTIQNVRVADCRILSCAGTAFFLAVRYGADRDIIRNFTAEDIDIDLFPQYSQQIQKDDDQTFAFNPRKDFPLVVAQSYTLGPNLDNQRNGPMKEPSYYHFTFENFAFRRFRVHGEKRNLWASFESVVPNHAIRNVVFDNMPDCDVRRKGNVEFGRWRTQAGYAVSDAEVFVDNRSRGRSGHMGHALIDCGQGRILAFNSNVPTNRCDGHSGYGWMEYRVSKDYGRTWGAPRVLDYSMKVFREGKHTALCEKGVRAPDGRIILFFQITDASRPISCEPWSEPTWIESLDGGETWSDARVACSDRGRIYDAVVDGNSVYFLLPTSPTFCDTNQEYVVYKSTDGGPFVRQATSIDGAKKGYGAMEFAPDGSIVVYAYDSLDEAHPQYCVSRDCGETWEKPGRCTCAKLIRNPQVRRIGNDWFMCGRNGQSWGNPGSGDGLVLYHSKNGIDWDEGVKIAQRPDGTGTGFYSCLLPIFEPGRPPRLLLQYSRPYWAQSVNVEHRWIEPRPVDVSIK